MACAWSPSTPVTTSRVSPFCARFISRFCAAVVSLAFTFLAASKRKLKLQKIPGGKALAPAGQRPKHPPPNASEPRCQSFQPPARTLQTLLLPAQSSSCLKLPSTRVPSALHPRLDPGVDAEPYAAEAQYCQANAHNGVGGGLLLASLSGLMCETGHVTKNGDRSFLVSLVPCHPRKSDHGNNAPKKNRTVKKKDSCYGGLEAVVKQDLCGMCQILHQAPSLGVVSCRPHGTRCSRLVLRITNPLQGGLELSENASGTIHPTWPLQFTGKHRAWLLHALPVAA